MPNIDRSTSLRPCEKNNQSPSFQVGGIPLPEPVPLLNEREDYRIGGGLVSAGGPGDGTWNTVTGPCYTAPNFIKHEELAVEVDDVAHPLRCEMFRGRLTGVYHGQERDLDE